LIHFTTITFLFANCTGCVGIWVPTQRFVPERYHSRRLITGETLEFIEVGTTSRADVLLNLGEPDALSEEERYYLYRWMSVSGWGFIFFGGGYSANGDGGYTGEQTDYLLIEFDEDSTVSWFGEVRSWPNKSPVASLALQVPYVLDIRYWTDGAYREGQLTLNEESVSLVGEFLRPDDAFTLDSDMVVGFDRPGLFSMSRYETPIGEITGEVPDRDVVFAMRFAQETPMGRSLSIAVDVFHFPALVDYLVRYCPNADYEPTIQ
jgi:hypothetical protein